MIWCENGNKYTDTYHSGTNTSEYVIFIIKVKPFYIPRRLNTTINFSYTSIYLFIYLKILGSHNLEHHWSK